MADHSHIEWTDATWNPITGCTMVSAGCTNCYAMGLAAGRLQNHPSRAGLTRMTGGRAVWTGEVRLNEQWLDQPLRWKRGRMIFVCAHGDLFHENVPDEWIDRVFAVMALSPQHTFQVLTKRPERARAYLRANPGIRIRSQMPRIAGPLPVIEMDWPLPNVWLGSSIEDQPTADARIPHLLAAPAAVRFLSCEPLLGPVDLARANALPVYWEGNASDGPIQMTSWGRPIGARFRRGWVKHSGNMQPWIDWVICGGESGPNARPMHPDWARSLRDQCQAAGVPFFFKQWGEWLPWEKRSSPMWQAQDCRWEDGNVLFPADMDNDPRWNDGLAEYEPGVTDHCAFERVGKRGAGRLLDGRTWDDFPRNAPRVEGAS